VLRLCRTLGRFNEEHQALQRPCHMMSAFEQTYLPSNDRFGSFATNWTVRTMSAFPPLATKPRTLLEVRFVPTADSRIARRSIIAGMSSQSILRFFLPRIVLGFLVGALYAGARYGSPVSGGLAGALCSASFISLERFVLRRNSGGFIRPLPFLAYFALRSVLYVGVIVFVIVVVNEAAGAGFAGVRAIDIIVAVMSVVGVILFLSVNDLLGPGVLFAFAAGRYHNPLIEERALLFIDMRASTAIAERLGELRYLSLLNRFVGDVSFAVAEASGGIHKYVGDEVIATWHLAPGANPPACVNAAFAALDRIAAQGVTYQREFGVVPDFRAGLHCGPVAVGELGSLRREIALIGDTMNTAARILEACRDTNNRVLASAALIERLATLPPGVTRRRLGEFPVRGKERRLELDVLEAEGPPKGLC
jgi:adenylate cyclase